MWLSVKRELQALRNDPWQLALITYIPVICGLFLWWIFSAELVTNIPVAVLNQDNSQLSRLLERRLEANSAISLRSFRDIKAAKTAMQDGDIYALVVIPHGFKKDLISGHKPTIDIRYNSQFLLVGKLLSSKIQISLADGLTQIGELKQWLTGTPKSQAKINVKPITNQITPLYNSNSNYLAFLLSPMVIALGQIIAMLVFNNTLGRELRLNTLENCYQLGIWKIIVSKYVIYMSALMMLAIVTIIFIYGYLSLPLSGAISHLLLGLFFMFSAVFLIVLLLFFKLQDTTRMVSFGTALFAPAFAFMGVTFPIAEMPLMAKIWRAIMPSSHYIQTHVSTISYQQSPQALITQLSSYWGYLLLIPVIYVLSSKTAKSISLKETNK